MRSNAGLGVHGASHVRPRLSALCAQSKPNRRLYVLTDLVDTLKMTTFNNGSLGSCNDEERSEMRKVMRFA